MSCPSCKKPAYYVCDNVDCTCWQRVTVMGVEPLRYVGDDLLACPCGFADTIDGWFERELEALAKESA